MIISVQLYVMRRPPGWPALSTTLKRSARADLDFLFLKHEPNVRHNIYGVHDVSKTPRGGGNTRALKDLAWHVNTHDFSGAENIFSFNPGLQYRSAALKLMIRSFCLQRDFTTAKAFLFHMHDRVGTEGAIRFVAHCIFTSANPDDICEVIHRFGKEDPVLVGISLIGLGILERVAERDTLRKGLPSRMKSHPAVMQATTFELYQAEEWARALEHGRTVFARANERNSCHHKFHLRARVPYTIALWFFARTGHFKGAQKIIDHMHILGIPPKEDTTLTFLQNMKSYWQGNEVELLTFCEKELRLPISADAVELMLQSFVRQCPVEMQLKMPFKSIRYSLLSQPSNNSDFRMICRAKEGVAKLSVLESMYRRGIYPPYAYFVTAFETLAREHDIANLKKLVSLMKSSNLPLHCAGIDLAVAEHACSSVSSEEERKVMGQQLVEDFLLQYPSPQLDLKMLTKVAKFQFSLGDATGAATSLDFLRSQSRNQRYDADNHDTISLQLLTRIRFSLHEPIVPLIRDVIQDHANIWLDRDLRRLVRRCLKSRGEPLIVCDEMKNHNYSVEQSLLRRLEELKHFPVHNSA